MNLGRDFSLIDCIDQVVLGHILAFVGTPNLYHKSQTSIKSTTELTFSRGIISIKLQ